MNKLINYIDYCIVKVVIILFSALVVMVWFAIIDRYLLSWQVLWVETAARYLMIWAMLLAIPLAITRKKHIFLTFLIDRMSLAMQKNFFFYSNLISTCIYCIIAYFGYDFVVSANDSITPIFKMPLSFAHGAIFVAFTLSAIQNLLLVVLEYRNIKWQ